MWSHSATAFDYSQRTNQTAAASYNQTQQVQQVPADFGRAELSFTTDGQGTQCWQLTHRSWRFGNREFVFHRHRTSWHWERYIVRQTGDGEYYCASCARTFKRGRGKTALDENIRVINGRLLSNPDLYVHHCTKPNSATSVARPAKTTTTMSNPVATSTDHSRATVMSPVRHVVDLVHKQTVDRNKIICPVCADPERKYNRSEFVVHVEKDHTSAFHNLFGCRYADNRDTKVTVFVQRLMLSWYLAETDNAFSVLPLCQICTSSDSEDKLKYVRLYLTDAHRQEHAVSHGSMMTEQATHICFPRLSDEQLKVFGVFEIVRLYRDGSKDTQAPKKQTSPSATIDWIPGPSTAQPIVLPPPRTQQHPQSSTSIFPTPQAMHPAWRYSPREGLMFHRGMYHPSMQQQFWYQQQQQRAWLEQQQRHQSLIANSVTTFHNNNQMNAQTPMPCQSYDPQRQQMTFRQPGPFEASTHYGSWSPPSEAMTPPAAISDNRATQSFEATPCRALSVQPANSDTRQQPSLADVHKRFLCVPPSYEPVTPTKQHQRDAMVDATAIVSSLPPESQKTPPMERTELLTITACEQTSSPARPTLTPQSPLAPMLTPNTPTISAPTVCETSPRHTTPRLSDIVDKLKETAVLVPDTEEIAQLSLTDIRQPDAELDQQSPCEVVTPNRQQAEPNDQEPECVSVTARISVERSLEPLNTSETVASVEAEPNYEEEIRELVSHTVSRCRAVASQSPDLVLPRVPSPIPFLITPTKQSTSTNWVVIKSPLLEVEVEEIDNDRSSQTPDPLSNWIKLCRPCEVLVNRLPDSVVERFAQKRDDQQCDAPTPKRRKVDSSTFTMNLRKRNTELKSINRRLSNVTFVKRNRL